MHYYGGRSSCYSLSCRQCSYTFTVLYMVTCLLDANARKRMTTDIGRVTAVKDKDGTLLTGDDEVKSRWLGYFDDLLNIENEREDLEGILPVQGPIEDIYVEEVITQMGKMKKNKACGPECLPIEVAKALGDEGAIWMTGVLNEKRNSRGVENKHNSTYL